MLYRFNFISLFRIPQSWKKILADQYLRISTIEVLLEHFIFYLESYLSKQKTFN
jgi:hypothetical protein